MPHIAPKTSVGFSLLAMFVAGITLATACITIESNPQDTEADSATEDMPVCEEGGGTAGVQGIYGPPPYPTSLDYTVVFSDVIVRAQFRSATARISERQTVGACAEYWPLNDLTFDVIEYLHGSGGEQITVTVLGDFIMGDLMGAKEKAAEVAEWHLARRDTRWDDREAILFLQHWDVGNNERVLTFALRNRANSQWDYMAGSLSPAWFPLADPAVPIQSDDATGQTVPTYLQFGYDLENPESIKGRWSTFTAAEVIALSAGTGGEQRTDNDATLRKATEAECESIQRAEPHGDYGPETAPRSSVIEHDVHLRSGLPAGSSFAVFTFEEWPLDEYPEPWVYDTDLFRAMIRDSDSDARNGFQGWAATTRPLPGTWLFDFDFQWGVQHPFLTSCAHRPLSSSETVSVRVTGPPGTIYEAFFEPLDYTTFVGVPLWEELVTGASDTPTVLGGIHYSSGTVWMSFDRESGLADKEVEFILPDGTVSLRLPFSLATVGHSTESPTFHPIHYSWNTCSAPWAAGDKLMVRIRTSEVSQAETPPPCFVVVPPTANSGFCNILRGDC